MFMYHSFLIHLSADGHLGCFHVLTIINRNTQIYTLDPDEWLQTQPASPPTRTARLQDEGGCGLQKQEARVQRKLRPVWCQAWPLWLAASHQLSVNPAWRWSAFPRASVRVTAGGPIPCGPHAFIFQGPVPLLHVRLETVTPCPSLPFNVRSVSGNFQVCKS